MKFTTRLIAVAVCAIALFGCQTDPTTTVVNGEEVTLSISLEPTRTSLGEKNGDTYPVFWSESDCIAVNGVSSEATIDASNKSVATFTVTASAPYNITYPYTEGLSASKVVFPTEQSYAEGTFAAGAAPMCGYVANKGDNVKLKHLAGVLRFPIKAANNGVVLEKVVITSTEGVKLSGEFEVNCTDATITASATDKITYTLPADFALSTTTEKVLYITLPAVETGICKIEFVEVSGEKMVRTMSNREIKAGIVRELKPITYTAGVGGEMDMLDS